MKLELGTYYGSAYFFSKRTRMKTLVAPAASLDIEDVCSAAISVSLNSAAAECKTGMETRTRTLEMMWASRRVH